MIIGIDVGKAGGIAFHHEGKFWAYPMPQTERDIVDILREGKGGKAYIEFVRSSPQMGVTSAFSFGQGYGGLRMALIALEIPFEEVIPRKWQAVLGCLSKKDKNVTKRKAQELFPNIKITHNIADSLLIAEYGRRINL